MRKLCIFLLLIGSSFGYFDDQPKLISENGNLVLESAKDRNITFRFKGSGCLNINDNNILNLIGHGGGGSSNGTDPGNWLTKISQMESRLDDVRSLYSGRRGILTRLSRVENRTRNLPAAQINVRLRNVVRRITRLENRLNTLTTKLQQDNCKSNPCQNGGTCFTIYEGFQCKCPDAWTGITCQDDVNECGVFSGTDLGCQNGATCMNVPGSYSCICQTGWQGVHCTRRTVDCLSAPAGELCGHGTCVHTNDPIGFTCICDQGWKTNGVTPACTVDVDECNDSRPHCSMDPPVRCINIPGSFMCGLCPPGYSGNGHYCSDINECETNNGGCSTAPSVPCINTRGSYQCGDCPIGWEGDGKTCVRNSGGISYCSSNPCHSLARCVETSRGPSCLCPFGYNGIGFGLYGCMPNNRDPCTRNPCLNGGTCHVNGTSFYCSCPSGTLSPFCRPDQNPCLSNPCRNGGTCTNIGLSFSCQCLDTFTGQMCQTEVSACGGVLLNPRGTLKYPISDRYPSNSKCAWLIRTNSTQVLNVTFTKFEVEYSVECRFDWLQIHDGRSSASHMIGRFCGTDLPKGGNIISTNNFLYLWFRSDNSSAHDGFELQWDSIAPVCGGLMQLTTFGTITSPGSPGNYPPNRLCEWHLVALPGKRIQLHFFTMQLESHDSCAYDYLAIYGGSTTNAQLLEKFCNTSHPEPLTSPANELMIQFNSDADGTDAGFQIHYSVVEGIPGCGGIFTMNEGEISSPTLNGVYPRNINCEYAIRMPKQNKIRITFKEFELENNRNCDFDYLEIYEGTSIDDPKVGKFCGFVIPQDYTSIGNNLLIVFKSDWSSSHKGFRFNYELVCGESYAAETGILMSPLYPQHYDINRDCNYLIEAPIEKAIVLDFQDLDIEDYSHTDCEFDFVAIYDGHTRNSTLLGKYCGKTHPPQTVSTFNEMLLVFQSDGSVAGKGFKANYSFIDITCGGVIKKLGFQIKPPMGDAGYRHESGCKWIISAPVGHVVQISFTSFDLESHSDCTYDSLTVYEGPESMGQRIGKYCGHTLPPVILSTTNLLTIVFASDASNNGEGFLITYNFIDSRNICGGNYYTIFGSLRSPGYPNNSYPSNKECIWIVNAPTGQQIELRVNSFNLESSSDCQFDYVEIRNGGNPQSPVIGKFCDTQIPKTMRSFSNQIYIHFKSDSSSVSRGFEFEWDATLTGCGGSIMDSPRGSITSPNYPQPYGENAQCDWRISVSPGSTIQLILTDLDMEEHGMCLFDSLQIYDGRDSAAKSLGKYCSSTELFQLNTTTNHAFLRMQSDVSNQGRGFNLNYNIVCKREIHEHRGIIESPNFPHNYPNNMNCEWTIVAPTGNKIRVQFSQFNLEGGSSESSCNFDYMQIEERNDKELIRSEKYCHSNMPEPFTTSTDIVTIKFLTDVSNSNTGFHLEFEVQGCGDHFVRPDGNFSSPNYPNLYPHNTHCEWAITTDYDSRIELSFIDFDFETSSTCYADGLVVADAKDFVHPIVQFCGSVHKPTTITSNTNQLYVRFYTDESYAGRGFSASYKSVSKTCGGIYKIQKGNIMSPNYPMNYEVNTQCEWFLETDEGHTMTLSFTDFDLEESPTCEHDFIMVYDGFEKDNEKLLLKHCGSSLPNNSIISTGNKLLVRMQSDGSIDAKGFNATFTTNCGSYIETNSSGVISVGSSVKWITMSCNWTIKAADPGKHIVLTFIKLQNRIIFYKFFESLNIDHVNCFKKISIYDGDSTTAPLKEEICGELHPPPVISNGNSLTIAVISTYKDYNMASGFEFEAHYSVLDNTCGGTYKGIGGKIASPLYPKSYPLNAECIWNIQASPGNKIQFIIEMLDIDQSENCNEDYMEIRENDPLGNILGVFCGSTIPSALPPTEKLWIKFRSDDNGVGKGFKAEYNYASHVELSGESGTLTSPLYPETTYMLEEQSYRITVEIGYVILISVDSILMKLDETGLTIFDGYDLTAGTLARLQRMTDETFTSSTNVVYLVIEGATETKFKMAWTQISKSSITESENGTETMNCTQNSLIYIEKGSTEISSPGYPDGYELNLNCSWTLIPKKMGYRATIALLGVDLQTSTDCYSEYLRIWKSSNLKDFSEVEKLCQQAVSHSIVHVGNPYLKLQFVSDFYRHREYYRNKTGFYGFVGLSCGGPMTGPNGILSKNMTRISLPFNIDPSCEWQITVRPGRTIEFQFQELNLRKDNENKCVAYILIRNSLAIHSSYLGEGQYCGNRSGIPVIRSSSNQANVMYFAGSRMYSGNFILKYRELSPDCGGEILLTKEANSTIITSPNYPNIPNPHIECVWTVTAPNGESITIDFVERFDLTKDSGCEKEYVEIEEGGVIIGHSIGRYCGDMPDSVVPSSNIVRIKYFTDVTVPKNGFKLIAAMSQCNRFYRSAPNGVIKSKGYPGLGAYPSHATCDYQIQGKVGSSLNFTFDDIDLPESDDEDCLHTDRLMFYNVVPGESDNVTLDLIGTYCHSTYPQNLITDGPEVLIRFITLGPNHKYKGFRLSFKSVIEQCGGDITAESGIITSPGYPYGRKIRKFCEWKITVPKGRRVKLDVLDLDLIQSFTESPMRPGRAFSQRLGIYNDHAYTSRIKFLTGSDSHSSIYSSDNKMLISMWFFTNIGHRGFKFAFSSNEPTICVGNLDGDEGTFYSPEIQNSTNFYCEYVRSQQAPLVDFRHGFGTLAIKISETTRNTTALCLPGNPTGVSVVFDSPHNVKSFLRHCTEGSRSYEPILSPFAATKVILKQGYFVSFTNQFRIDYKVHRCGGIIFSNMTFALTQPNFTTAAYGEVNCAWQFKAVDNLKVNINVSHTNFNCEDEYINVFNGLYSNSPKIVRVCGSPSNGTQIALNGHNVFIEYHSANYNPKSKFQINFHSSYSVCGGLIQTPIFKFRSPLNGTQYPNQVDCLWTIKAQKGFHIGLEFVERFFLQESVNCTKDFIEISNMIDGAWHSVGRVCGRQMPTYFNSTGPEMLIRFRTDDSVTGDGFVIKWRENCGGIFDVREDVQTLTSPYYPDPYPRNIICNYTLVSKPTDFINVKFDDFEMEETAGTCRYDNVTVYRYDEYSYSQPYKLTEVGTYCWKGSLTTLRFKHKISLILRSDSWVEKRGFKFDYSTEKCGGIITNQTEIGIPIRTESATDYNGWSEKSCIWNVTAPANKTIIVRFKILELYSSDDCYSEYIQIFDGYSMEDDHQKAKLCGNLTYHRPSINVGTNRAIIRFTSNSVSQKYGFEAGVLFLTPCQHQIDLTEANPVYTLNQLSDAYASELDCQYKIIAPKGYALTIDFKSFHLAPCSSANQSCSCDFVEIRDGPGVFSELIAGPLCGHTLPLSVTTTTNSMWIRFTTDNVESSSGFNATITAIPTICGKEVFYMNGTQSSFILEAPRFPQTQQLGRCRWYIQTDVYDEYIQVIFEELNVPCENGFLQIIDENAERIITEGTGSETVFSGSRSTVTSPYFYSGKHYSSAPHQYCGTEKPPYHFYSSSNKLQIKYSQLSAQQPGRFKLTVKTFDECSRNFTSLQGRLFARKSADCVTHITVPENNTISLYFTRMGYYFHSYNAPCTNETLPIEIYDGRTSKLIRQMCGDSLPNPLFANTNSIYIKFKKLDLSWIDSNGLYDITYVATDQGLGCGGQIFNYGGGFSSPLYPQNDRNYSDCRWDIRVPDNLVVALQFDIFDMGSKTTCTDNYVQIIEIANDRTEKIARQFCGEDSPSTYKGSSSILSVRFKKTRNFAGTGWKINFMGVVAAADIQNW